MIRLGLRWFPAFVIGLGLAAELCIYHFQWADAPIRSDGVSYYVYLPSVVLHGSPRLGAIANHIYGGHFPWWTGILEWPNTSWWLNPHPIGVALLMLPFFLVAHLLTLWSNLPPDGFSRYYQMAAAVSGLVYGALGLALLQRQLARAFSDGVVLATLVSIAFGTNLFHYLTFDASYSHAYSFFLASALVWLTATWHDQPTRSLAAQLGLVAGLLVLVRHTNGLLWLIPLLYGVGSSVTVRQRLTLLRERIGDVLTFAAVAGLCLLPQLLLYRSISGSWLIFGAYQLYSQTFDFSRPDLLGVLFSVQKGLFFWSPLLLAGLAGFVVMPPALRNFRLGSLLVLVALTYLIASWFHFGGSYGHRGFTDVLPLLALPLASIYGWLAHRPLAVCSAAAAVSAAAVFLSVFQMLQYWLGVIPFNDTTWEQYRNAFLRLS